MPAASDDWTTLFIVLGELIIDLPDNVLDLEWSWRDNRHAFDRLKAARPDYWDALVARAADRKAELRHAGHLTPSSGRRPVREAWSAVPIEAFRELTA